MHGVPRQMPGSAPDDAELLAGVRAGDSRAVERLYRTHVGSVQRVIGRLVGATPDFEDLVQLTFLEALRTIDNFRGVASLKTWLSRIAVHVVQHHLRAGRVRRHVTLELVPDEDLGRHERDHDQDLDEKRLSAKLHGLLDQLSPKKRIAFVLFVIDGRPVEEVAALMNATATATRSRVFFARRELRKLIAEDPQLAELAATLVGPGARGGES